MKSRITTMLSIGILTPIFVVAPVLAVDQTPTDSTTTTTTTTTTTPQQNKDLQSRIQKREDALKTKLTAVQAKQIQNRCKKAQGVVVTLQTKVTGLEAKRTSAYANVLNNLTGLEAKLDQKNADTIELQTEITDLRAQVASFTTDLADYKVSANDLANMDCVTDPTGFQASLDDARAGRKKVQDDGVAIRAQVINKIKPTLAKIRVDLGGKAQTDTTTANPTAGVN